ALEQHRRLRQSSGIEPSPREKQKRVTGLCRPRETVRVRHHDWHGAIGMYRTNQAVEVTHVCGKSVRRRRREKPISWSSARIGGNPSLEAAFLNEVRSADDVVQPIKRAWSPWDVRDARWSRRRWPRRQIVAQIVRWTGIHDDVLSSKSMGV